MRQRRVLITGSGGMLGDAVVKALEPKSLLCRGSHHPTKAEIHLDITDKDELSRVFSEFKPDLVFHLAAMTNTEYCETHPEEAMLVNARSTATIVELADRRRIPIVYISSSGIFDGEKDIYTEDDVPSPITAYGASKYEGEKVVGNVSRHYIFRAGWMVGGGPLKDKKFVGSLMRQIKGGKKELFVVNDLYGTISYTHDLVQNMLLVIDKEAYGLYHAVNDEACNRYDVAQYIVSQVDRTIHLHPVPSAYFKDSYKLKRPRSEALAPKRLKSLKLYVMPHWHLAIQKYLSLW